LSVEPQAAKQVGTLEAALAALQEKEERLHLALAAAEMGTWDWDPATGDVTISPEIQRMLKVQPTGNRVSAEAMQALIHPDDLPRVVATMEAAVAKGAAFRLHLRMSTGDGVERAVVARGCVLWDKQNPSAYRVIGVARDVTSRDRNRAEQLRRAGTIQRDRATLLAIMASMTDGLIVANATKDVRSCSDQAAQLLGTQPEQLVGAHVDEVCTLLLRSGLAAGIDRTAWSRALGRLAERPRFEVALHHPARRDLEVQLFPIAEVDAVAPSIGIVLRDVSTLRLLALLQERERIAMDLHDGVIQSLYALGLNLAARERMLPAESEEARAAFRQAQEQLADVIQEARSFIVDLRLEHAPGHSLGEGLEELAGHLRINGLMPELELADVQGLLPAETTPNVLYIAREAISNVLRHAKASEVMIRLARADDEVILTIRDNGLGFDPRKSGRRSGDGLRNIAERTAAVGGTLHIASQPGQGTTIELRCPISSSMSERSVPGTELEQRH
jgi:signal transduction histidine kinase